MKIRPTAEQRRAGGRDRARLRPNEKMVHRLARKEKMRLSLSRLSGYSHMFVYARRLEILNSSEK